MQGFFLDLGSKQLLRLVAQSTGGTGKNYLKYQMLGIAEVLLELGENSLRNNMDWRNTSDRANKGMATGFRIETVDHVWSEKKIF